MTDNKNIFTNNKKSDSQNVKDNLLIDEFDTYSDYVHEFSDSYKNRKEELCPPFPNRHCRCGWW